MAFYTRDKIRSTIDYDDDDDCDDDDEVDDDDDDDDNDFSIINYEKALDRRS